MDRFAWTARHTSAADVLHELEGWIDTFAEAGEHVALDQVIVIWRNVAGIVEDVARLA